MKGLALVHFLKKLFPYFFFRKKTADFLVQVDVFLKGLRILPHQIVVFLVVVHDKLTGKRNQKKTENGRKKGRQS